jgi:hypothetical protein
MPYAQITLGDIPHVVFDVSNVRIKFLRTAAPLIVRTFRDDLVRSNILFTTYSTQKLLGRGQPEPANAPMRLANRAPRGVRLADPVAPCEVVQCSDRTELNR